MTFNFNNVVNAYGINNTPLSYIYGKGDYLLWPTQNIPPTPPTPSEYDTQYLTFEFLESGTWIWRYIKRADVQNNYVTIYYNKNDNGWIAMSSQSINSINVQSGDKIKVKGLNDTYWGATVEPTYGSVALRGMNNFGTGTARFNVYGNMMSLIYGDNFANNTSITKNGVFANMFMYAPVVDASNLILPSTTLTEYCYYNMFSNCQELTTAPKLLAPTLTAGCYEYMFDACTNLNKVECYATNISASYCTYDWLYNTASTGTFIKTAGVNWPTGESGIPNGWTVVNAS